MKQTYKVKDRGELIDIIRNAKDNEDLNYLDVSKVENMRWMFYISKVNGDISKWDVSKVENMRWMFNNSKFNQDISNWNISSECFYNSLKDSDFSNKTLKVIIDDFYKRIYYKNH